jgi:prevent-host-death family protein
VGGHRLGLFEKSCGILFAEWFRMKSLPLPVAHVRNNLADVLDDVRGGQRVRVTRHGKPVGWIIGEEERARLSEPPKRVKPSRSGRRLRHP